MALTISQPAGVVIFGELVCLLNHQQTKTKARMKCFLPVMERMKALNKSRAAAKVSKSGNRGRPLLALGQWSPRSIASSPRESREGAILFYGVLGLCWGGGRRLCRDWGRFLEAQGLVYLLKLLCGNSCVQKGVVDGPA